MNPLLPEELIAWATRHAISPDALHELNALLTAPVPSLQLDYEKNTETYNQNTVRVLASSREHTHLWRNNNGAFRAMGVPDEMIHVQMWETYGQSVQSLQVLRPRDANELRSRIMNDLKELGVML